MKHKYTIDIKFIEFINIEHSETFHVMSTIRCLVFMFNYQIHKYKQQIPNVGNTELL